MKNFAITLVSCLLLALSSSAQRYAVIDSKYILEKMPEYKASQQKLDQFSEQWQQEIDKKSADLDKMYQFQRICLTVHSNLFG